MNLNELIEKLTKLKEKEDAGEKTVIISAEGVLQNTVVTIEMYQDMVILDADT